MAKRKKTEDDERALAEAQATVDRLSRVDRGLTPDEVAELQRATRRLQG